MRGGFLGYERLYRRAIALHRCRAYRRYQVAFPAVFARFTARLLVADERVELLEGDWPRDKLFVMEFPDEAEARRFTDDPDYAAISVDRKAGADAVVVMARGFGLRG